MSNKKFENLADMFGGDDIFSESPAEKGNQVMLDISMLVPFKGHPFKLYSGARLDNMVQSIKEFGIMVPVIVRPAETNTYEILSGHNRSNAAKLAGLDKVPAIIKDGLTDEEATLIVTETNFMQRSLDDMLPSEKAFAFDMEMKALARQGKKTLWCDNDDNLNTTSTTMLSKFRSDETVGAHNHISREMVRRFRRLVHLTPELLHLVDDNKIAVKTAAELSYLKLDEQAAVYMLVTRDGQKVDMRKAKVLRELSEKEGKALNEDAIKKVLCNNQKSHKVTVVKLPSELISRYFTIGQTEKEVIAEIEKALNAHFNG